MVAVAAGAFMVAAVAVVFMVAADLMVARGPRVEAVNTMAAVFVAAARAARSERRAA